MLQYQFASYSALKCKLLKIRDCDLFISQILIPCIRLSICLLNKWINDIVRRGNYFWWTIKKSQKSKGNNLSVLVAKWRVSGRQCWLRERIWKQWTHLHMHFPFDSRIPPQDLAWKEISKNMKKYMHLVINCGILYITEVYQWRMLITHTIDYNATLTEKCDLCDLIQMVSTKQCL